MQVITAAIESGNIERSTRADLVQFNAWLCHSNAGIHFAKNYGQVCETVRLHLLRSMIDAFEERSKAQYRWVLFFAFLAILATLMPYFIPPPSDTRTIQQPTAPTAVPSTSPLPRQESPAAAPRHDSPPSSRPAKNRNREVCADQALTQRSTTLPPFAGRFASKLARAG